jgi:UDPglucose 6-dehydrogenase
MKIAVVGTGYVGLTTGACLAERGNEITCLDVDEEKIRIIQQGRIPIYEPDLEPLIKNNTAAGRLYFTTDMTAVAANDVIFLTVGTPQNAAGGVDMTALTKAVSSIAPNLKREAVVVVKSTVPVGTNARVGWQLLETLGRPCDVVSNPEFLCEGSAVYNLMYSDRIIVGVRKPHLGQLMRELYDPFLRQGTQYLVMTPESAELTKYAANAMLAMKIGFINEIAAVCDSLEADIRDVRRGIGTDHRIGFEFLGPGPGYGGSCFPKDVRALQIMACKCGRELPVIGAIDASNESQKLVLGTQLEEYYEGDLRHKTIAVWGLAFKPGTDDIREAPALILIDRLLKLDANVRVHDPVAMDNVRRIYGDALVYAATPEEAIVNAAALAVVTDWDIYRAVKLECIATLMATPVVFDGRYMFDLHEMSRAGIDCRALGCGRPKPAALEPAGSSYAGGVIDWAVSHNGDSDEIRNHGEAAA